MQAGQSEHQWDKTGPFGVARQRGPFGERRGAPHEMCLSVPIREVRLHPSSHAWELMPRDFRNLCQATRRSTTLSSKVNLPPRNQLEGLICYEFVTFLPMSEGPEILVLHRVGRTVSVTCANTVPFPSRCAALKERYPPRQESRVERLKAKVEPLLLD